ncbi:MAG: nucleotidyltransferase domain-containing protein [archaeon]|nr:nucleotidyltransferase domain-containing protein [archaeon]
MGQKTHLAKLKTFKKELSKDIVVNEMILFGSRAWGKPNRYSDFDIIVVSSSFRKKKSLKRSLGFYKRWNLDYPVDFLCYTPEEFNKLKKEITIVQKAVREGIIIT